MSSGVLRHTSKSAINETIVSKFFALASLKLASRLLLTREFFITRLLTSTKLLCLQCATIDCNYRYYYWRRGVVVSGVRRMNEVNACRARLVPGWVTVFGRVYHLGM